MIKIKHASFLLVLVLMQACASSQSSAETTAETSGQTDSLAINRSQTPEKVGITVNSQVKTKSIVTPVKKKK